MNRQNRTWAASSAACCCLLAAVLAESAFGQQPAGAAGGRSPLRPVPNPIVPAAEFRRAVARGTRAESGVPGPDYWQQHARYTIAARLDVEARRLDGTMRVVYLNNSPDTLPFVILQLLQNHHRADALRLAHSEATGGYAFTRVSVAGRTLQEERLPPPGPGYFVNGTNLLVNLPSPVAPRDSVQIDLEWSFRIPQRGIGARMGWSGDDLFFLAYFYPQMTVYDDVVGWQADQYLGVSEFYAGFGDYDVTLDVPEGWLVRGTGRLVNEREVLPDEILRRLRLAEASDTVVHVLPEQDFGPGRATMRGPGGRLRWRFAADTVRDVAYSVTRASVWDAARAGVGDRDGDGRRDYAVAEAIYRPRFQRWRRGAHYAQHALAFHSHHLGFPYPYQRATAVEGDGIIGVGQEFPMITLIGGFATPGTAAADTGLYGAITHELAHNWMPMVVNSDERRHGWMDEGATWYNEGRAMEDFFPGYDGAVSARSRYVDLAQRGGEAGLMRWSWLLESNAQYVVQSYAKPATLLATLRRLLGDETFARIYRGYVRVWALRHPKPWDFFNYFGAQGGMDLRWFWRSWYEETWTLDQAVATVTPGPFGTEILIRDVGDVPMPARVTVTLAEGDTLLREIPLSTWLGGERTATVTVPGPRAVTMVEIDAERRFPDLVRKNNVWLREAEALPQSLPPVVRNELVRMSSGLLARGYSPDGPPLGGSAADGSTESRSIALVGGTEYAVLAVCDEECGDLDLVLRGPSGSVVARDLRPDDTPVRTFRAPASGSYRLDVVVARCRAGSCAWGARVLRR